MPRLVLALMLSSVLVPAAHAAPESWVTQPAGRIIGQTLGQALTQSPGEQCRAAIAAAEKGHAIPAQLMAAIGRVESGKRDPGTGAWGAWPWTINAEGAGAYFDSKADAIRAVQGLQARGVRSIDVGCMQVNLMHHPTAFPTLDMAFEPAVNADYAARFLVQLHDQTGDWTRATANYHSANPAEGLPYAAKVTSVWPEEQRKAGTNPPPPVIAGLNPSMPGSVMALPGRPLGRMFATAGLTPQDTARSPIAPRTPGRIMPLGPNTALAAPSGLPPGQALSAPGRGLDFYRTMPIRSVTALRIIAPLPGTAITR